MNGPAQPTRPTLLDRQAVAACLQAVAAAPSIHNTQPWQLRVHPFGIEIHEDPARRLTVLDPTGRASAISVGAALFNLRVTLLEHHRLPLLLTYSPTTIMVDRPAEPTATVRALAEVIPHRRTSRTPFADTVVPVAVVDELRAAAHAEGAVLIHLDAVRRDAVLAVTRAADDRHRADPAYHRELAAWTDDRLVHPDGIPPCAYGPLDRTGRLPVRDFGLGHADRFRRTARFERYPQLVLLATPGDRRTDWLRAGQALQRILLTATIRSVSTQPMTQALEFADLRALLPGAGSGLVPQMLLRIGYGLPGPPTPRRPLPDLLPSPGLRRRAGTPTAEAAAS
jgi:hypothetical protein